MPTKERPSGIWQAWREAPEKSRKKDLLLGRFLTAHEGFARFLVSKVLSSPAGSAARGMPKDDLLQAARLGLLLAAQKWEPKRGKFTTVAYWLVINEVQCAITKDLPYRGKKGLKPKRVSLRRSLPAPPMADSALEEQGRRELANAIVLDLTKEERALLFGKSAEGPKARDALLAELRELFAEDDEAALSSGA